MTATKDLANLLQLERLRTHQLAAIRERIVYALVDATPEDVESARRAGALVEPKPVEHGPASRLVKAKSKITKFLGEEDEGSSPRR